MVKACQTVRADSEKLAQDKIEFGKKQTADNAKVEAVLCKVRELTDIVASFSKAINIKISEIIKL